MSLNAEKIERLNFYAQNVLKEIMSGILNHEFEIVEVLKGNQHAHGKVGITIKFSNFNYAEYNMNSVSFIRDFKVFDEMLNIQGVVDVHITNSKNFMVLYDEEYLEEYLDSQSFMNVFNGYNAIEKFSL